MNTRDVFALLIVFVEKPYDSVTLFTISKKHSDRNILGWKYSSPPSCKTKDQIEVLVTECQDAWYDC